MSKVAYSKVYDKAMTWWTNLHHTTKEDIVVKAYMIENGLDNNDVEWGE